MLLDNVLWSERLCGEDVHVKRLSELEDKLMYCFKLAAHVWGWHPGTYNIADGSAFLKTKLVRFGLDSY